LKHIITKESYILILIMDGQKIFSVSSLERHWGKSKNNEKINRCL